VPILFDVILHMGTLVVILMFFRKKIGRILSSAASLDFRSEYGSLVPLILVGTIPTVLIGGVFGRIIEDTFHYFTAIGFAFIFCGTVLHISKYKKTKTAKIGYSTAIAMGVAQGLAIIPGISRSGITIAVALLLGIKQSKAFEFSFLLSVPAILGALAYTTLTEFGELAATGLRWEETVMGVLLSMLIGYLALRLLRKALAKRKFHLFAFYCWILGVLLLVADQPFGFSI
ncbi:MAG: undecaprenyl-diphosphate phosphatase, partial [Candidatus Korarchaeota archaeon]|nr:undecaprenyl-diphosphate phosphatase [Candidatus Korarchaeota archaeon]